MNLGAHFYKTIYNEFGIFKIERNKLMELVKCNQIKELSKNKLLDDVSYLEVSICGTINEIRQIPTKLNPNKFLRFITFEDETGVIDCVCFDKQIKKFDKLLQPNNKVIITGEKFLDNEDYPETTPIIIQNVKLVK